MAGSIRKFLAGVIAWLVAKGDPIKLRAGRRDLWVFPVAAGADDEEEEGEGKKGAKKDEEDDAGDGSEDGSEDGKKGGKGAEEGSKGGKDDDEDDDEDEGGRRERESDAEYWRRQARRRERREKEERDKRREAEGKLKEREDADKTESEKAIDKARREGKEEAEQAGAKERRNDRLDSASTRMAARGVTIGEGDKEETKKFADPDDAMVYLERAMRNGDVDEKDLFDDDGKVKKEGLREALGDILIDRPHLVAKEAGKKDEDEEKKKPKGGADGGRGGDDNGEADLEEMSPDDHFKRIKKGD